MPNKSAGPMFEPPGDEGSELNFSYAFVFGIERLGVLR